MASIKQPELTPSSGYIGRFAPTPSGPLHFGSLVAALASFLDARAHRGQWLLRIEDIDAPRCVPGAADSILQALEDYGLLWDASVCYQSQQNPHYQTALEQLQGQSLVFFCTCSRSQLKGHGMYPGTCRTRLSHDPQQACSCRIRVADQELSFTDLILPSYTENLASQVGDFILQRKDGPYAYQLAVVVDDALQGITHVIRGADLYTQTIRQMFLQQSLGFTTPAYGHIPLIINDQGQKLSKQNMATAISAKQAPELLSQAIQRLGQALPQELFNAPVTEQLEWAIAAWDRSKIPALEADPTPFVTTASH